jgi:hypothetical protein
MSKWEISLELLTKFASINDVRVVVYQVNKDSKKCEAETYHKLALKPRVVCPSFLEFMLRSPIFGFLF